MSYLKLNQTRVTSFQHEGQTFKVIDAPAPVFDAYISQIYEDIADLDRHVWDIYAKWDILNDAIGAGDLLLVQDSEGFMLEIAPSEEKTTGPEEKTTELSAPELQTSDI